MCGSLRLEREKEIISIGSVFDVRDLESGEEVKAVWMGHRRNGDQALSQELDHGAKHVEIKGVKDTNHHGVWTTKYNGSILGIVRKLPVEAKGTKALPLFVVTKDKQPINI